MKLQLNRRGFTLIELLVAMTITMILVATLMYMTGISVDTYKKSREEVRANRLAKEALETIAKDLEGLVAQRDGNNFEWLYCANESNPEGPSNREITNASQLIFFTAATDRYDGQIGQSGVDNGGDVSTVGYRLVYRDQITNSTDGEYDVFALYRNRVEPDETFQDLLAEEDLEAAYTSSQGSKELSSRSFLVENIYELTITFLVEYSSTSGTTTTTTVERVTMGAGATPTETFSLKGNGIELTPTNADLTSGQLIGAEISITVLTDQGLELAKRVSAYTQERLVREHGYHFTKSVILPRS